MYDHCQIIVEWEIWNKTSSHTGKHFDLTGLECFTSSSLLGLL